jgi:hypothetical protein
MTTWLLIHFSLWQLALLVIGGTTVLAMAGCVLVRRRFPTLAEGTYNELSGVLLGIFAAIYGVLLAFVVVILWESRGQAADAVASEAAALSQVVQDSQGLAPGPREAVDAAVASYLHAVVGQEWPSMSRGAASPAAVHALDGVFATVRQQSPRTDAENVYYSDLVSSLNDASTSRRARLAASDEGLPGLLGALIVAGAVVFVPLTYLFGIRRPAAQFAFVGFCGTLVAVGLFLTVVLDRPFAGGLGLDPGAFRQGALARYWPQP